MRNGRRAGGEDSLVFLQSVSSFLICVCVVCLSLRSVAKMDQATVEIDDGKEEIEVPDTMYQ